MSSCLPIPPIRFAAYLDFGNGDEQADRTAGDPAFDDLSSTIAPHHRNPTEADRRWRGSATSIFHME
jgi:hypothetical protein